MTENHIHAEKAQLRQTIRELRRNLPDVDKARWNGRIAESFCSWPLYQQCRTVMFYLAMPDEAQTAALIQDALQRGKQVCAPLLGEARGSMSAAAITDLAALVTGRYGLQMPDPHRARLVAPECIDLVVAPGIAFTPAGYRLGMGAGYYDRFLPKTAACVWLGLCWECQLTDDIPCEPHDVRLHYILTENRLIDCRNP